jgi:hypothetical protein
MILDEQEIGVQGKSKSTASNGSASKASACRGFRDGWEKSSRLGGELQEARKGLAASV